MAQLSLNNYSSHWRTQTSSPASLDIHTVARIRYSEKSITRDSGCGQRQSTIGINHPAASAFECQNTTAFLRPGPAVRPAVRPVPAPANLQSAA